MVFRLWWNYIFYYLLLIKNCKFLERILLDLIEVGKKYIEIKNILEVNGRVCKLKILIKLKI